MSSTTYHPLAPRLQDAAAKDLTGANEASSAAKALDFEVAPLAADIIARLQSEWRALAAQAVEPNPFFEPIAMRAALRLPEARDASLLIVRRNGRLCGLAPLAKRTGGLSRWLSCDSIFQHRHAFLGAPMVSRGDEDHFAETLFDFIDSRKAPLFFLPGLNENGPLRAAIERFARANNRDVFQSRRSSRALAVVIGDFAGHLADALGPAGVKSLRAKRRRLEMLGPVAYEVASDAREIAYWFRDYASLEAKGRARNTNDDAILNDPNDAAFWRSFIAEAAPTGRMRVARLTVNKRPIAISIDLDTESSGFALRIAEDPAYALYSPGALLELDNLRAYFLDGKIDNIDASADGARPALDALWGSRQTVVDLCVPKGAAVAGALARICALRTVLRRSDPADKPAEKKDNSDRDSA
ncbi:MAG: GNAT family N-acetyltransferase [Pseudomonadota bacterium]